MRASPYIDAASTTVLVLPKHLKADCSACQALCCVATAFDAGEHFALSKPAHRPCPLLLRNYRCSIHEHLERRGFSGCASYDCYGAGQRVTRHFERTTWRESPERAREMFEMFRKMRIAHELMAMLTLVLNRCAEARVRVQLEALLLSVEALVANANPEEAELASARSALLLLARSEHPQRYLPVEASLVQASASVNAAASCAHCRSEDT